MSHLANMAATRAQKPGSRSAERGLLACSVSELAQEQLSESSALSHHICKRQQLHECLCRCCTRFGLKQETGFRNVATAPQRRIITE